jgi:hypothetical protein
VNASEERELSFTVRGRLVGRIMEQRIDAHEKGQSRGDAAKDGMRIFLAGSSGVIGQRLIPRLVQAGHVVGGLTRSPSKTELLSHLGAEPILCDVFDREALIQAVRDFKPDVRVCSRSS